MPDKRTPCENGCPRCWRNRLKHGNPEAKKYFKKHELEHWNVTNSENEDESTDTEINVKIDPTDLVESVKRSIGEFLEFDINKIHLTHDGMSLLDNRQLLRYKIGYKSILQFRYKQEDNTYKTYNVHLEKIPPAIMKNTLH